MILIDGKEYKVSWLKDNPNLEWNIINGDNSGRLQGTKEMFLDYVGTFYKYTGEVHRDRDCTDKEWIDFILMISAPINKHTWVVPFGEGKMEWEFYSSTGNNNFIQQRGTRNDWERKIKVELVPLKSQWLAGNRLRGVSMW